MKAQYTPDEYVAELQRQTTQAASLVEGLGVALLNWQPMAGKSWSVGQCLDHLTRTNTISLDAMRAAVEENRDQLEPRTKDLQPSGPVTRFYVKFSEPPPKMKIPAPKRIAPPSQLSEDVLTKFAAMQNCLVEFLRQYGGADLGDVKYKNSLVTNFRLTIDTGLVILAVHNRRHLWQAEQVRKNPSFPRG
jgi:hypothetical protein